MNLLKPYLYLTGLVLFISFFLYKDFLLGHRLYLYADVGADTINQYWPTVQFFQNRIINGDFSLFAFEIGIGASILSFFSIISDFFLWPLFFIKIENFSFWILAISVLKILFSGLFFLKYIKYTFPNGSTFAGVISGTLYSFNEYTILWGQHYFFATLMVLLPLILLGYEYFLRNKKWIPLLLVSTCMGIFSVYYSYMVIIFLGVYVFARYAYINTKLFNKTTLIHFFYLFLIVTLGAAISAIISFPLFSIILNSPRIGGETYIPLFESTDYYSILFSRLISASIFQNMQLPFNLYEMPVLSISLIFFLLLPLIFLKKTLKGKVIITTAFLLSILALIFPFFSWVLNGLSGISYRWTFFLIILQAITIFYGLNKFRSINNKFFFYIASIISLIFLLNIYIAAYNFQWNSIPLNKAFTSILILFLFSIVLGLKRVSINLQKAAILFLVVVEVLVIKTSLVNDRVTLNSSFPKIYETEQKQINNILKDIRNRDQTFFRVMTDIPTSALWYTRPLTLENFYSTEVYSSLPSPSYFRLLESLNMLRSDGFKNTMLEIKHEETAIQNLLNIKYFITKSDTPPNDNFILESIKGDFFLYKNINTHDMVKFYNHIISEEEFTLLNTIEKKNTLLTSIVTHKENLVSSINKNDIENNTVITEYKKGIVYSRMKIKTPCYALFAIPYSSGWSLLVNGEPAPIKRVNIGFMGIFLEEGEYNIAMKYTPPGLKLGIVVSSLSFLIFLFIFLTFWRLKK